MIYLDNAATSFPRSEAVLLEMDRVNRSLSVNAGRGSYKSAREAAEIIRETKDNILKLLDAKNEAEVVITPSTTHSMNQILDGLTIDENSVIYLSAYEHNAVARTVERIRKQKNCRVVLIPTNPETYLIDLEKTAFMFEEQHPTVVISTVVSNVTGYRLPVEKLFEMAHKYCTITVADAAQAAGLININFKLFNADVICFAGHKTLCGPFGVAGFLIRKGLHFENVFSGGTGSDSLNLNMPDEVFEAGSPNIVAIAGLNVALKELNREKHEEHVRELTSYLIEKLSYIYNISIKGVSKEIDCIGIVSFVVEGYDSNDVGTILDNEFDIAVRTGYHCAPYIHSLIKDMEYSGTVRVGIGPQNTKQDIDALLDALETL